MYDNFYCNIDMFYYSIYDLNYMLFIIIIIIIVVASFLLVTILNALTFMPFVSFGTYIFGDKRLQLPLHLSKQIMNGYYLSSTGFKLIRVGLTRHGSSFKDLVVC